MMSSYSISADILHNGSLELPQFIEAWGGGWKRKTGIRLVRAKADKWDAMNAEMRKRRRKRGMRRGGFSSLLSWSIPLDRVKHELFINTFHYHWQFSS